MPSLLLLAWPLALTLLAATALAQDPCQVLEDVAERIACYAAEDAPARAPGRGEDTPGWRAGEDTDPITDETSVVLRRRAQVPHRDVDGTLVLPSLTITCYRGREVLLSLEALETLAEGDGTDPAEIRITYRIASDAPLERSWLSSPPDYQDAYMDQHLGSLLLAQVLAEEDPGDVLFRYRTVPDGAIRTVRFGLEGLADLLPWLQRACGSR